MSIHILLFLYYTRKNIQNNPPPKTTQKKVNTRAKTTRMFQEFSKWLSTGCKSYL